MKKTIVALGKALCYTLAFFVSQLMGAFLATVGYCAVEGWKYFKQTGSVPYTELMQAATAFTQRYAALLTGLGDLLGLFALWAFFRIRGKRLRLETNWTPLPKGFLWPAVLCGGCFAIVVSLGLVLLPIPADMMQAYAQSAQELMGSVGPLSMFCIVIVAPLCEEVFFRGLVYTRLKRGMPALLAAVIESLIFGALHGTLLWMLYAFFMALVMTFVYERCGSLKASIGFHIAFNLLGLDWAGLLGKGSVAVAVLCAASVCAILLLIYINGLKKRAPKEQS